MASPAEQRPLVWWARQGLADKIGLVYCVSASVFIALLAVTFMWDRFIS